MSQDAPQPAKPASSSTRVLAVLGLFSRERPVWHADEINEALGYTRATGYRYVRELMESGFLRKVSAGRYALGSRIIELDYQLRQSDPVLLAAIPVMHALAARSRLDVVLSTLFGAGRIIDIHRVSQDPDLVLRYGRGRPRPLFQGAAPKVILASLPRATLLRIHQVHEQEIAERGLGGDWAAFRRQMTAIRQRGMYVSAGELDEGVGAAAMPVLDADGEVVAALALVGTTRRIEQVGERKLRRWLEGAVGEVGKQLSG